MFHVIEFSQSSGGGLGIVREEWLTPRKKEAFWPPYKVAEKFNKCLLGSRLPNDDWKIYEVKKVFYTTDNVLKARQKLKEAEEESEIASDADVSSLKRRRKPSKRVLFSDSESDDNQPPKNKIKSFNLPQPPSGTSQTKDQYPEIREERASVTPSPRTSILSSPPSQISPTTNSTQSTTQPNRQIVSSPGVDAIASHLARINRRLDEMEKTQNEILARLCPTTPTINILPPDVKLPCETLEEINDLEDWLLDDSNKQSLTTNLSLLGGKKVGRVVRNILEKIFTNDVAEFFNWTGRHNKRCLRDLAVIKLIPGAVRKQRNLSSATEDEINTNIANWFRFSKDRNGGREQRRKEKPRQDCQE